MNGDTLYALRDLLDLNEHFMAAELGLSGAKAEQAVHEMETGKRPISGPISKLAEHIAARHGYELINAEWIRTNDR